MQTAVKESEPIDVTPVNEEQLPPEAPAGGDGDGNGDDGIPNFESPVTASVESQVADFKASDNRDQVKCLVLLIAETSYNIEGYLKQFKPPKKSVDELDANTRAGLFEYLLKNMKKAA